MTSQIVITIIVAILTAFYFWRHRAKQQKLKAILAEEAVARAKKNEEDTEAAIASLQTFPVQFREIKTLSANFSDDKDLSQYLLWASTYFSSARDALRRNERRNAASNAKAATNNLNKAKLRFDTLNCDVESRQLLQDTPAASDAA